MTEAPKRRRPIGLERMTRQIRVTLPVEVDERLRSLSDRYNVAAGTIARAAIKAGMKAVTEQLRRAATRPRRRGGRRGDAMSAGAHPSEATRRVSILRSVRAAARRQADVVRSAR